MGDRPKIPTAKLAQAAGCSWHTVHRKRNKPEYPAAASFIAQVEWLKVNQSPRGRPPGKRTTQGDRAAELRLRKLELECERLHQQLSVTRDHWFAEERGNLFEQIKPFLAPLRDELSKVELPLAIAKRLNRAIDKCLAFAAAKAKR